MKDDLEMFFAQQRARVKKALETRCGEMEDIPEVTEVKELVVEVRGNCTHAQGKRKPSSDDQGSLRERGLLPGKRRHVVWSNYERKHHGLPKFKEDKDDEDGIDG